ncbi:MAG: oxygenase MpaB family protein [Alcanivorax sp.]|nr:oxygenase MpaB family protein [Alcanivorax sp.]
MLKQGYRYKWMRHEIARLDPFVDAPRIIHLHLNSTLPASAMLNNLIYTLGLVRLCASREQAIPVHRDGKGKVYRKGDQRADETNVHLLMWLDRDLSDPAIRESLAHVRHLHGVIARKWPMRKEAFLHALASFTLLLDRFRTRVLGAPPVNEQVRHALVHQFVQIGEMLGIDHIPPTWEGMEGYLEAYEDSVHLGYSEEGAAVANALINQFVSRWLPRGLRQTGRKVIIGLLEAPIADALRLPRPGRILTRAAHTAIRALLFARCYLLPDPRRGVHFSDITASHPRSALPKCPVPH